MVKDIDPSDIGKHPVLIRKAQCEMANTDVLVCGKCHSVFNFIEQFVEHRQSGCSGKSDIRASKETKPKVWAFLLWKASQLDKETANAWKLYQSWVKLDEATRETWVVAGRTIQSFSKIGQGNLQEMPVKITKTVVDTITRTVEPKKTTGGIPVQPVRQVYSKAQTKKDENHVKNVVQKAPFEVVKNNLPPLEQMKVVKKAPLITRAPLTKLPANPVTQTKGLNRTALRTIPNTNNETDEQKIEKILAKRFNPRRKVQEYLIKWENFAHEENTWEAQTNLVSCSQLLDIFEKQLARQKEQRAALQAKQAQEQATAAAAATTQVAASKAVVNTSFAPVSANTTGSSMSSAALNKTADLDDSPLRQLRNQKTKAMDNVRNWCAQNTEEFARKRKMVDSDYEHHEDDHETDDSLTYRISPIKPPPAKVAKMDNSAAVAQALIRAGQSGSVRIVPVTKPAPVPVSRPIVPPAPAIVTTIPAAAHKLNGANAAPVKSLALEKHSAEVVFTNVKDGKQTGIVRKPGAVVCNPIKQRDALVRIVQKGESVNSGVVRISDQYKDIKVIKNAGPAVVRQTVPPQPSTTTVRQSGIIPKPNVITRPAAVQRTTVPAAAVPVNQHKRPATQPNKITRPSSVQQFTRTSMSPATSPNTSTGSMAKPVTRVVQKPTPTQTEKLVALQRHGDLKITRKTFTPANSPSGQPPPIIIKKDVDDTYDMNEILPKSNAVISNHSPQQQISLCPISGRVLGGPVHMQQIHQQHSEPEDIKPVAIIPPKYIKQEPVQQILIGEQSSSSSPPPTMAIANTMDTEQETTQIHEFVTNDDGSPMLVTGEDGTVYQVAGKNEHGQTVLITQGADGEQQFLYVANEGDDQEGNEGGGLMEIDQSEVQTDEQMGDEEFGQLVGVDGQPTQFILKAEDADEESDASQMLSIATDGDSQDGQLTAEVIQADLPSPGGTRKVVLMLPDGSFVMTEVSDEQFQSLNIN